MNERTALQIVMRDGGRIPGGSSAHGGWFLKLHFPAGENIT